MLVLGAMYQIVDNSTQGFSEGTVVKCASVYDEEGEVGDFIDVTGTLRYRRYHKESDVALLEPERDLL